MPRYIDAEALIKEVRLVAGREDYGFWETSDVVNLICRQDTHDVVPASEVNRLRSILNDYALQYGTVKDQQAVIDRVKQETARKIFSEIEKIVAADDIHEDLEYEELLGAYAAINRIKRKVLEFKMKYTGGDSVNDNV